MRRCAGRGNAHCRFARRRTRWLRTAPRRLSTFTDHLCSAGSSSTEQPDADRAERERERLGFAMEEQVRLFKLSKERLMDPHPDRSDYRSSTHILDGLAATVSRSSGARQGEGEDGSNDGANAVLGGATQPGGARGKAPVD